MGHRRDPRWRRQLGQVVLTIPAQSKNVDEAYKFIDWVTQPAQRLAIFQEVGNMPSQPGMYTDPALLDFKNDYFNNSMIGQIFTKTAQGLKPQYLGKKNNEVRAAVENVLNSVRPARSPVKLAWPKAWRRLRRQPPPRP